MNLELFSPVFVYTLVPVSGQTLAGILGKSVDFWTCFHNHGLGSECPNIELVLGFPQRQS